MNHVLLAILFASALPATGAQSQSPSQSASDSTREISVTFDDLPIVSRALDNNLTALKAATARLLATLTAFHVPAIGFVNAGRFAPHDTMEHRRVAVLQQWIDAGMEIGNHTYSHIDFDETTLKGYIADTQYGDSLIRALLLAAHRPPPMWFRHPYLHTGRDSVTRTRFESWLAQHGYRVAPVTVNSDEYLYAARYARAAARHDSTLMQTIAGEYVAYMSQVIARSEQRSRVLFGREIRQILLLHANPLNADHFGELAQMLQARGYQFVPIARTMEDPVYAIPDRYYGTEGLSWLGRWALRRRSTEADSVKRAGR